MLPLTYLGVTFFLLATYTPDILMFKTKCIVKAINVGSLLCVSCGNIVVMMCIIELLWIKKFFGVENEIYKVNWHTLFIYCVAPPFKVYMSLCHFSCCTLIILFNTSCHLWFCWIPFFFYSYHPIAKIKHTHNNDTNCLHHSSSQWCKESPLSNLPSACLTFGFHRLSQLVGVVLIPRTHTILPSLKIIEG